MKILHTSDWHLGKILHEVNLLEDQKYILNQLLALIDEVKPDVLMISGDLYDRSVPSKEAVNLLDSFFYEVVMVRKMKVIAIAGNHDSGDRIDFVSRILTTNGLYIKGRQEQTVEKITFDDAYGKINFYLLPYCDVSTLRYLFKDDSITNFDEAYQVLINKIKEEMDLQERNIVLAHGFIININEEVTQDDSVRPLSVGNVEYVNSEYFKAFDYVALGHLHRPSKVKYDYIRYSGSLMKYSFSEHNQKKGVYLLDIKEKGNISIEFKPLKPIRDVRVIKGKLNDLIEPEYYEKVNQRDYLKIVLTDERPIYDAYSILKGIYPNILTMAYSEIKNDYNMNVSTTDLEKEKNVTELFSEFYENMTGKTMTEEQEDIVDKLFNEVIKSL